MDLEKYRISSIPFKDVKIDGGIYLEKMRINREVTLRACIERCEETGRISNFEKAAGTLEGKFEGRFYNDSDVYKVLEGVAYALAEKPDPYLECKADSIIEKIAKAQQKDGYLNTYFQLVEPENKWTDMGMHEMYCAGHLIEAAIAYKQATGKTLLFEVACRFVEHMKSIFGPGKRNWVPGHEEIELALVKLYKENGDKSLLEFSIWLVEQRGKGLSVRRDLDVFRTNYNQDDKPVAEMSTVSGHAVRAMYLYSALADIVYETGNVKYAKALEKLWDNVVNKNMYITGGIGSTKTNEGFTRDYDLPNKTAYCETCASIGMVYWNHRMNLLHGNSKYADIVEKEIFNGALSGISLDGDKFFYDNVLESDGNKHRLKWFNTSCCPTQLCRFIPSIGNYIYMQSKGCIWVNQFIQSNVVLSLANTEVKLYQKTNYPWNGKTVITVETQAEVQFTIRIRIPGWCKRYKVILNETLINDYQIVDGYLIMEKVWENGDVIILDLDMPVRLEVCDPKVEENVGKVAIVRGPLVYCIEEADNSVAFDKIFISEGIDLLIEETIAFGNSVCIICGYNNGKKVLTAVPYYLWDNRQPGKMKVWIDNKAPLSGL